MGMIYYNSENYYFGGIQEGPIGDPSIFPLSQEDIDKIVEDNGGSGTGGNIDPEQKEITCIENGVKIIEPSGDFDGLSSVKVTVDVPQKTVKEDVVELSATENGTVETSASEFGVDGLKAVSVSVNVPQKTVKDDAVELSTTENGTVDILAADYDVDGLKAVSVTVNVPSPSVKPEQINITATTNSVYTINAADYNVDGLSSVQILVNVEPQTPTTFYYSNGRTSLSYDTIINDESYSGDLISVEFGNSVTRIADYAFSQCTALSSVTLSNSISIIGSEAFNGTDSLTEIIIPSSVTNIGSRTFSGYGASRYIDITFESTTPISLVDGTEVIDIFGIDGTYSTTPTIHVPEGYETIYATHDAGWEALAQYIVGYEPSGTTSTFYYSDGTTSESGDIIVKKSSYDTDKTLTSIQLGTRVNRIDDNAFEFCRSLTSVTIPDSVTSIGEGAFYDCASLSSVTIPDSVTSIGENAFYINSSGTEEIDITFVSTNPITLIDGDGNVINIFGEGDYTTIPTIHVPVGYEDTYATHDRGWEALAQYIVRP